MDKKRWLAASDKNARAIIVNKSRVTNSAVCQVTAQGVPYCDCFYQFNSLITLIDKSNYRKYNPFDPFNYYNFFGIKFDQICHYFPN